jgi:hypothetical protein
MILHHTKNFLFLTQIRINKYGFDLIEKISKVRKKTKERKRRRMKRK